MSSGILGNLESSDAEVELNGPTCMAERLLEGERKNGGGKCEDFFSFQLPHLD